MQKLRVQASRRDDMNAPVFVDTSCRVSSPNYKETLPNRAFISDFCSRLHRPLAKKKAPLLPYPPSDNKHTHTHTHGHREGETESGRGRGKERERERRERERERLRKTDIDANRDAGLGTACRITDTATAISRHVQDRCRGLLGD